MKETYLGEAIAWFKLGEVEKCFDILEKRPKSKSKKNKKPGEKDSTVTGTRRTGSVKMIDRSTIRATTNKTGSEKNESLGQGDSGCQN
jgi:hypothetical protein